MYLFMATLGLRCCAQAFSSCGVQGYSLVAAHGLLIVVASLVVEHGTIGHTGFSSCGAQTQLPCSMWNPP